MLITVKELRDRLGAGYSDAELAEACETVSALIRGYTGQTISRETHTHTLRPELGELKGVTWPANHPARNLGGVVGHVRLPQRPVVSVSSVVADGVTVPTDKWWLDPTSGVVVLEEWDVYAVEVTYVAGYSPVPLDIKAVAKAMAREHVTSGGNVKRERLADYEVEYGATDATTPGLANARQVILNKYRGNKGTVTLG